MKTLSVVGTSHLAAIKLGWDRISKQYPDTEVIFFGAAGEYSEHLKIMNGSLVPADADAAWRFKKLCGRSEIGGACDGFVICDFGIKVAQALRLYGEYRAESHSLEDCVPVSDECFHLALLGILRASFAVRAVEMLRKISTAPIALLPSPMRSSLHSDSRLKAARDNGDETLVANEFGLATRELAAELNVRLFGQPAVTLISPLCTDPLYTLANAKPKDLEITDKDYGHMNELYGEIVLREILAQMFEDRVKADINNPAGS